ISAVGLTGNLFDGTGYLGATSNVVLGNFIGTDVTGAVALGNVLDGVKITSGATNNTVGGSVASARNIISGNAEHGVYIFGGGTNGNVVLGNYVGTNAAGTAALGNLQQGIVVWGGGANNTIGGLTATPGTGAGNVVSGNGYSGIGAIFSSNNNWFAGNIV